MSLIQHIKATHEKKKDHKCYECDEGFAKKSNLKRHIKDVHLQKKEHICEHCSQPFPQKEALSRHIKEIHFHKKSHNCDQCDISFQRKAHLSRHIKEAHTNTSRSNLNCYQRFFNATKYGPVFGCVSCYIANYIVGVYVLDEKLKAKLEEKYDDPEVFSLLLDKVCYNTTIQATKTRRYLDIDKDGTGEKKFYICKDCKNKFIKNRMPSRCVLNENRVADQLDALRNMSEVEVSLIAQNIQFRKIVRLPKTQWAQLRDRVICVPVPCQNIKNTISSLPKLW